MTMACPELASSYAQYPMRREAWLKVDGQGPGNVPGFISSPSFQGLKQNYVFGQPKHRGVAKEQYAVGYYHLLTRESYNILFRRVSEAAPVACCCFGDAKMADAYGTTKTICWNRSLASKPDDQLGAQEALQIAQQIANRTYNWTQNEQLVVHAVLLAT